MILVTGASGFVGQPLCRRLGVATEVKALVRTLANPSGEQTVAGENGGHVQWMAAGDLHAVTDWSALLRGVSTVIHLAARTHVLHETASEPLAAYRRINVEVTERLARSCAAAGVKRVVFLSSITVNGESTCQSPFRESDTPQPQDAYGFSKHEAEVSLTNIGRVSGLEIVIVRPPLVYGPGVKGNFLRLLNIARQGWPLPLASVQNLRSFIYVENLVDAIATCATHPKAAGKTYLVSDAEDTSTPELLRQLSSRLGKPARLIPFPPWLLRVAATMVGRGAEASRLLGSLRVDSSFIQSDLDWTPPFRMTEGLNRTVQWHKDKFQ